MAEIYKTIVTDNVTRYCFTCQAHKPVYSVFNTETREERTCCCFCQNLHSITSRSGSLALELKFLQEKKDGVIPLNTGWGEWKLSQENLP